MTRPYEFVGTALGRLGLECNVRQQTIEHPPPQCGVHCVSYTLVMTQLVTRIDDELLAQVDLVISWGELQNRSEAVRQALVELVNDRVRRRAGQQIADAYLRVPQTSAETAGHDTAAREMIAAEPW